MKSEFDKLYENAMGDDIETKELGIDFDSDVDADVDDIGDEESSVTVTLTPGEVEALKSIVSQLGGEYEDEVDDEFGDLDDLDDVHEDNTHTTQGTKPGVDPTGDTNVKKKVGKKIPAGGSDELDPASGLGDGDVTDEIDGGSEYKTNTDCCTDPKKVKAKNPKRYS